MLKSSSIDARLGAKRQLGQSPLATQNNYGSISNLRNVVVRRKSPIRLEPELSKPKLHTKMPKHSSIPINMGLGMIESERINNGDEDDHNRYLMADSKQSMPIMP
jgi:hypothetical protein